VEEGVPDQIPFEYFVKARSTMFRDMAAARAQRFGRPVHGSAFDDEGMGAEVSNAPYTPPMLFHLIYQDGKNDLSGRCMTLRNVKQEVGEVRLSAGACES
jgi:hypothetical protein